MHEVEQVLIVGVGVHGRHQTLLHAEGVVEDLDHGDEAVGRAGGVGHDRVLTGIEGLVVDADDEGGVGFLRGGGDDHPRGARFDVHGGLVAVGEDAGGFDHHVDAEVAPGQGLGIALGQDLEGVGAHGDAVAGDLDLFVELAVGGVVLQQVGVDLRRGEVVHRHQVDIGSRPPGRPVEVAPDAPEAVDAHAYRHGP